LHTLAKKDEESYLRALHEKEQREQRKQDEQMRNQLRSKQMNVQGLSQQLQEKQVQRQIKEIEEKRYGELVKHQVLTQQQMEALKQEEAKRKQKEYLNELGQQVEEARVKKRFGVLMTEHERRVNDKDIKAYENRDTQNIYSQIPGIKGHDQQLQEKYVNKIFSTHSNDYTPIND